MKRKIQEYFLLFSNVFLILGIMITSILIVKLGEETSLSGNINLLYLPFVIFLIIATVFAFFFIWYKKQYLILVVMHVTKKSIRYYFFAFILVATTMIFAVIWVICSQFVSISDQIDWYFYTLLGICMFLTLVSTGLNEFAKISIKIDLAKRRKGIKKPLKK